MVISVINQKGGVCKSTTAASVGAYLSRKGSRVLFVDLDPQGNLSDNLGAQDGSTALDLLTGKTATPQTTPAGDIIPAAEDLSLIGNGDIPPTALKTSLQPLKRKYDYVILDTPPALSIITLNALAASDKVIIPAQADTKSLKGIARLYQTISAVKDTYNKKLDISGILLTRHNPRAIISRDMTDVMKDVAEEIETKVFNTTIRECTAIKEAEALQLDIFSYAPKSNAAADYAAFTEEFLQ